MVVVVVVVVVGWGAHPGGGVLQDRVLEQSPYDGLQLGVRGQQSGRSRVKPLELKRNKHHAPQGCCRN
ncbi:hypothetical protein F7725_007102 [Dissostichus mawsoni]|uniref:Secreted protein n=1 Tax=Dissostichus mawsoni TaxID=36200 RepID=A0A7J5XVU0_DISMA|nr:hypothetical protein F7725_007102 [Dissostichus mawsoni]